MALPYGGDPEISKPEGGAIAPEVVDVQERALVPTIDVGATDAVLRALQAVRTEMADRDGELRDVLGRLGRLYERIAASTEQAAGTPALPPPSAADEDALRALLRSIETLATVTEASVDRASDLGRSLQYLVEAVQGLATRVDRLVTRTDVSEARLERVSHVVEGLSEQVAMIGRRLGTSSDRPRPSLRAVGRPDAPGD